MLIFIGLVVINREADINDVYPINKADRMGENLWRARLPSEKSKSLRQANIRVVLFSSSPYTPKNFLVTQNLSNLDFSAAPIPREHASFLTNL